MIKIRAHVSACSQCHRELESLKQFKNMVGDLPPTPEAPAGLESKLLSAVREANRARSARPLQLVAVMASSVLVFMALTAAAVRQQEKVERQKLETIRIERSMQRDQVYATGLDATSGAPIISCSTVSNR